MYSKHLERALTFLKGAGSFLVKAARELMYVANANRLVSGLIIGAVVVLIGSLAYFFGGSAETDTNNAPRAITLITVGDVSSSDPLELIGEIRAVREASVSPDSSGQVKAVYRGLGDFVAAGTVIAELENARQRAGVTQAKAALEKARSAVNVGTISVGTSETSFESAIASSRTAAQSARTALSDVVRRTADKMFSNPEGAQPKFLVLASNQQLIVTVEAERLAMQPILSRYVTSSVPESYDELIAELTTLATEAIAVEKFLTDLASVLSVGISSSSASEAQIAQYRLEVNAALQAVSGTRTSITSSLELVKSRRAGVDIAKESLSQSSGTSADILAAEANLASAEAQLETTIIRAPISGSINRIDLEVGSFASPGMPVVYITSSGALEAAAYVTERDIRDIAVGAKASVRGDIPGTVVRVARALDPVTKKAEVRIALPQSAELVSGQSATILIERSKRDALGLTMSIPLSALKITPDGSIVFTVVDSTLVSIPVTLGRLSGSRIEIESGLTLDSVIVEDARGLKEGQKVEVANQ